MVCFEDEEKDALTTPFFSHLGAMSHKWLMHMIPQLAKHGQQKYMEKIDYNYIPWRAGCSDCAAVDRCALH